MDSFTPYLGDEEYGTLDELLFGSTSDVINSPLPDVDVRDFAPVESSNSDSNGDTDGANTGTKKRKSTGNSEPANGHEKMTKRERNRMHAKNSRERKKLLLSTLEQGMQALQTENDILRTALSAAQPQVLEELKRKNLISNALVAKRVKPQNATAMQKREVLNVVNAATKSNLCAGDFLFMEALQFSRQSFVITDPKMPDNPIVFASDNFFTLTGYERSEVLGRNCRFLQGPETDIEKVKVIREAVATRKECECILLNYRKDGSKFYNKLYVSPLLSTKGDILNFMAVQTELTPEMVERLKLMKK